MLKKKTRTLSVHVDISWVLSFLPIVLLASRCTSSENYTNYFEVVYFHSGVSCLSCTLGDDVFAVMPSSFDTLPVKERFLIVVCKPEFVSVN